MATSAEIEKEIAKIKSTLGHLQAEAAAAAKEITELEVEKDKLTRAAKKQQIGGDADGAKVLWAQQARIEKQIGELYESPAYTNLTTADRKIQSLNNELYDAKQKEEYDAKQKDIKAVDAAPTTSTGEVTQNAAAATDSGARTQAATPPQQEVNKDGKVVVTPPITAGTNAIPAVAPDGITFGTNAALRPYLQTQATPATLTEIATPTTKPGVGSKTDDATDTGLNATKKEINLLFGKDKKIIPQPNILDQYASYTYTISLYMMSNETFKNISTTRKLDLRGAQLLMQSGGAPKIEDYAGPPIPGARNKFFNLDYYIDRLEIETSLIFKDTGSAHNVLGGKLTIMEPMGITLIQNLDNALADILGEKKKTDSSSWQSQNYLLVIRFYGYDSEGNIVRVGKNNAVVEKFYPIFISTLTFKIANKITEYELVFSQSPMAQAFSADRGTIPYPVQFSGITVRDALSGKLTVETPEDRRMAALRKEANDERLAYGGEEITSIPPAPPTAIGAPAKSDTITSGLMESLNRFQLDKSSTDGTKTFIYPDVYGIEFITPVIGDAKIKSAADKSKTGTPMPVPKTAADKALPDKQSVNTLGDNQALAAGTQIVQVIEKILRNSTYIKDQQLVTIDDNGVQTLNGIPANSIAWFRIGARVFPYSPWDRLRNDYAYNITYTVNAYKLGDAVSEYFISPTYNGPHKEYKYWYTGENTSVISLEQSFNNLYTNVVSGSIQKGLETAGTANKNSLVRNTWQTRSDESSQGADGRINEPAANLAGFLYDPSAWNEITLTIVGDPAWLMQGGSSWGSSSSGFSYDPFNADGTINIDASTPFFEVSFNTPSDYDFETGIIKPTGNDTPSTQQLIGKNVRNASETFIFSGTKIKHEFKQGKFTQVLQGTGSVLFKTSAQIDADLAAKAKAAGVRSAEKLLQADVANKIALSNAGAYEDQNSRKGKVGSIFPATTASLTTAALPGLPTSSGQVIGTASAQFTAAFAQTGARLTGAVNTTPQTVAPSDDAMPSAVNYRNYDTH